MIEPFEGMTAAEGRAMGIRIPREVPDHATWKWIAVGGGIVKFVGEWSWERN